NAWDAAGGIVIVKQAGGHIVNFKGGNEVLDTRELLATNSKLTDELLDVIKLYFK
ncbi:MAG: inositol monophosphatase family protein, partial [Candidatus Saccharimonadales bacterium]